MFYIFNEKKKNPKGKIKRKVLTFYYCVYIFLSKDKQGI